MGVRVGERVCICELEWGCGCGEVAGLGIRGERGALADAGKGVGEERVRDEDHGARKIREMCVRGGAGGKGRCDGEVGGGEDDGAAASVREGV